MLDILVGLLTESISKPIERNIPHIVETAYAYEDVPEETPEEVSKVMDDPIGSNCYAYVALHMKLPLMALIRPNTTIFPGAVAIFQYKVKHIAIVKSVHEGGFVVKEANYIPGVIGERFIKWNDPRLVGFWTPPTSPDGVH